MGANLLNHVFCNQINSVKDKLDLFPGRFDEIILGCGNSIEHEYFNGLTNTASHRNHIKTAMLKEIKSPRE
jgi:hypothetical protein